MSFCIMIIIFLKGLCQTLSSISYFVPDFSPVPGYPSASCDLLFSISPVFYLMFYKYPFVPLLKSPLFLFFLKKKKNFSSKDICVVKWPFNWLINLAVNRLINIPEVNSDGVLLLTFHLVKSSAKSQFILLNIARITTHILVYHYQCISISFSPVLFYTSFHNHSFTPFQDYANFLLVIIKVLLEFSKICIRTRTSLTAITIIMM